MWNEIGAGEVGELLGALIRDACVNDGTADSGGEDRAVATLEGYTWASPASTSSLTPAGARCSTGFRDPTPTPPASC